VALGVAVALGVTVGRSNERESLEHWRQSFRIGSGLHTRRKRIEKRKENSAGWPTGLWARLAVALPLSQALAVALAVGVALVVAVALRVAVAVAVSLAVAVAVGRSNERERESTLLFTRLLAPGIGGSRSESEAGYTSGEKG
jgi:hypothetical protein